MSDAVSQILQSSAPGQFEDVVVQLGKLGGVSVDPSEKQAMQRSRGIGVSNNTNNNDGSSVNHPLASQLQEQYTSHLQTAFSGTTRGGVTKKITSRVWVQSSTAAASFQLCSVAEKFDLANLQTGQWKSTWTIGEKNGTGLSGTVELHTYAFEDGNTQLQLSKSFEQASLPIDDPTKIISQIIDWEHEVVSLLRGLEELTPDSLKKIRRVLPITKTKMNWEVEAQRGVQYLKKTAKER